MNSLKTYVAGFVFGSDGNRVILIRKLKPSWQAGYFNAVGGAIEPGETPKEAMIRECEEEINLKIVDWKAYCSLEGDGQNSDDPGWKVHWFYTFTNKISQFKNNTQEVAEIFSVKLLPEDTISNIPYLLHMALNFSQDRADFLQIKEINY